MKLLFRTAAMRVDETKRFKDKIVSIVFLIIFLSSVIAHSSDLVNYIKIKTSGTIEATVTGKHTLEPKYGTEYYLELKINDEDKTLTDRCSEQKYNSTEVGDPAKVYINGGNYRGAENVNREGGPAIGSVVLVIAYILFLYIKEQLRKLVAVLKHARSQNNNDKNNVYNNANNQAANEDNFIEIKKK